MTCNESVRLTWVAKECPLLIDSRAVAKVAEDGPSAYASAKDNDTPEKVLEHCDVAFIVQSNFSHPLPSPTPPRALHYLRSSGACVKTMLRTTATI